MATDSKVLHLGAADAGRLVSQSEFAEAEFDEPWTYEREEGRLVVVSPCGEGHVSASEPWRDHLGMYKLQHPEVVQRVVSEAWMQVDGDTDRIGDIGVYLVPTGPVGPIPDRVPELVFEFVSPGRVSRERDYVKKRKDYRRYGVREYVVIDRFTRRVTVYSFAGGRAGRRVLKPGDVYRSPLLPGLAIALDEVLPAAE